MVNSGTEGEVYAELIPWITFVKAFHFGTKRCAFGNGVGVETDAVTYGLLNVRDRAGGTVVEHIVVAIGAVFGAHGFCYETC